MAELQELIDAIKSNDKGKVRELLAADPRLVSLPTGDTVSLVLLAAYNGRKDIAQMLIDAGARLDIFEACATGQIKRVQELIKEKPDRVNSFASDGFTPLGLAAFFGYADIVTFLLAKGANPNLASKNEQRVTPLHSAVAAGHFDIAGVLLENGAKVNVQQEDGFTPLQEAAANGRLDLVELLLDRRADVSARNNKGQSALDLAEMNGHADIAGVLRQHAAS